MKLSLKTVIITSAIAGVTLGASYMGASALTAFPQPKKPVPQQPAPTEQATVIVVPSGVDASTSALVSDLPGTTTQAEPEASTAPSASTVPAASTSPVEPPTSPAPRSKKPAIITPQPNKYCYGDSPGVMTELNCDSYIDPTAAPH